jgi:hypothetical protein
MTIPDSVRSTDECKTHSMNWELSSVIHNTGIRKNVMKLGCISGLHQFRLYSHRIARERSLR